MSATQFFWGWSESLVLDQLIISKFLFFLFPITCLFDIVFMWQGKIMSWSLRGINGLVIEDRPNFQLRNSLNVVYYQWYNLFWHPTSVTRQKRRNSAKFNDHDSYGFSICLIIPRVNLKSSDVFWEKLFVPSSVCQ